jgi:hypothetical protein
LVPHRVYNRIAGEKRTWHGENKLLIVGNMHFRSRAVRIYIRNIKFYAVGVVKWWKLVSSPMHGRRSVRYFDTPAKGLHARTEHQYFDTILTKSSTPRCLDAHTCAYTPTHVYKLSILHNCLEIHVPRPLLCVRS